MKSSTIENDTDYVAVPPSATDAEVIAQVRGFGAEAQFAGLASEWPTSRLIRIWNALPGVIPVKRFTSRRSAVARIWNYIRTPDDVSREQTPDAASPPRCLPMPESALAASADSGSRHPRSRKRNPGSGNGDRRTDAIIALLRQPGGATLDAIKEATGWQSHSVRGFISGTVRRKLNLNAISARDANGARIYSVEL